MSPPSSCGHRLPALAQDVNFVPAGTTAAGGLLHRRSTGMVARIGAVEWEVLRRFDGSRAECIRQRVERECGVRLTLAELDVFARHACDIGLLESPGPRRGTRPRWRGLTWSIPLWNPERVFTWCAPRTAVLFHPVSIGAGVLVVMLAALTFIESGPAPAASRLPAWSHLVLVLTLLNVVSIVHECGHGLALHRCGGCVREIGVRFVLGWPCWYCDITESYLLPRLRQRIAVLLAGPFFQAVTCAVVILIARGAEPYAVALRTTAALLGALSAINLFPLVRSDGYYLLTEIAGMPNLRTHAWKWLSSSAARKGMRARLPRVRRMAIAAYAIASLGFIALVLGRAVTLIGRVFVGTGHFSIVTVTAALSIIMILTTVIRSRSVTP